MTSFFEDLQRKIVRAEYQRVAKGYIYRIPNRNKRILFVAFSGMSLSIKEVPEDRRHYSPENLLRTIGAIEWIIEFLAYQLRKAREQVSIADIQDSNIFLCVVGGGPDQEKAMYKTALQYMPKEKVISIADMPQQSNTGTQMRLVEEKLKEYNFDIVIYVSEYYHLVRVLHTAERVIRTVKAGTAIAAFKNSWQFILPRHLHWLGFLGIPIGYVPNPQYERIEDELSKIFTYPKKDLVRMLKGRFWYGGLTYKPVFAYFEDLISIVKYLFRLNK